jgi:rhodanese-related sulfurtransferase
MLQTLLFSNRRPGASGSGATPASVQPAGRTLPGVLERRPAPIYDGVDDLLADARTRLERLSPRAAFQEVLHRRGMLVDIRPDVQRAAEGVVHPSLEPLVVERNVLEWRFDPRQEARLPQAGFDARVIVLCQEGYTSSLAADALVRLGVVRATDVVGGFAAWRAAGMPVA